MQNFLSNGVDGRSLSFSVVFSRKHFVKQKNYLIFSRFIFTLKYVVNCVVNCVENCLVNVIYDTVFDVVSDAVFDVVSDAVDDVVSEVSYDVVYYELFILISKNTVFNWINSIAYWNIHNFININI